MAAPVFWLVPGVQLKSSVDSKEASRSSRSVAEALSASVLSASKAGSDRSSSQEARGNNSPTKSRIPVYFSIYFSMVVVLIACVLSQFGIPIDLDLGHREEQMFLGRIALSDGMEKIQSIPPVLDPDQVEPPLALKGQFNPALLEYGQSQGAFVKAGGDILQIGAPAQLVEVRLCLWAPVQFVQGLGLHQQHIGKAQHRKVHGAVVKAGDLAQGHQKLPHIVTRIGI